MINVILLSFFVLLGTFGCHPAVLYKNDVALVENTYQVSALGKSWVRQAHEGMYYYETRDRKIYPDFVYLRCPGLQKVELFEFKDKSFGQNDSWESYLYKMISDPGTFGADIKDKNSYKEIEIDGHKAFEIIYNAGNSAREFCTTNELNKDKILKFKSVWILKSINKIIFSFTDTANMILMSYSSPPETFEEGLPEFDEMVKSFQFEMPR